MLRKIPHTYAIVFYIILIAAVLTWIIPGGEYVETTHVVDDGEVTSVVFQETESQPQSWQVFSALFKGFERQAGIIVFILMIGGAFWIMNYTKAIDVGIFAFIRMTRQFEKIKLIRWIGVNNLIIALIMIMFSIFGAVFGMSEETIAFIIILVPLSISMGYDSIVGVCMVFVAAGLGFAGAFLNPFTIGIAQGIAELPLYSGIYYRLFCWLVITTLGIVFVLRYANKVKKKPESSLVFTTDAYWRKLGSKETEKLKYYTPVSAWISFFILLASLILFSLKYNVTTISIGDPDSGIGASLSFPFIPVLTGLFAILGFFSLKKSVHFYILIMLAFTILFLIIGVMGYQWYIMKIAALFFAMGIFSGLAFKQNASNIVKLFLEGCKDILSAAVIVGLAGGIIVILEDGKVIDTILYVMSKSMNDLGQIATVGIMYVIQTAINVVIPSGSAKAALTMPIMAPFSDLVGLSRQATVVAFQFGDGFTNMITPTSGVLLGVLSVAKIPYEKWVRWVTPLIILLFVLGFLLLIPTVTMNLNGF
ncbi:MAG: YfcC family protein [Bacteroidetes bacterium]|nr:YfcC family protein [Bacteroidota bacterium]MBL6963880.1 YfcC family protein [Bacteroidota bacterium]